jgi:hypothetical protein
MLHQFVFQEELSVFPKVLCGFQVILLSTDVFVPIKKLLLVL